MDRSPNAEVFPGQDTKHYSREHYAQMDVVDSYEQDRYGGPAGRWLLGREACLYGSLIPGCGRLLDVGAGTGKLLRALCDVADQKVGVDASLPMLREARRLGVRGWLVVADAHDLPFRSAAFDWVVSSRVLLHVARWPDAVEDLCRVAAEGVVVDVPTVTSFAPVEAALRRLWGLSQPYRVFRLVKLRQAFQQDGLQADATIREFFFPYRLHRILRSPTLSGWLEKIATTLRLTKVWGNPAILRFRRQP